MTESSVSPPDAHRVDPLEPWPDAVEWRPVSPKLITVELINRAIWVALLLAGLFVGWMYNDHELWLAGMGAVVLFAIWRSFITVRAVRAWGYAERDNDLLVRHGLVIRRLSIVPYARMQYVDVTAGPLERAFQLATVQLHTASAASDAKVPGLPPEEASRLRDRLTALGEDRAEGL
ncbi:PH domain-containing protein [Jidongwangia harbinensis]|uniref:PH domain-containing protein n=1 Tax=Jidongwangia harbinensis TaxID=2878561 RepID=UPI001CDA3670|nr:PH domain-containing protein [Jidongwangia harbinensis]MCA2212214.1 PH domain-containing protein [Jidongwangia harbinensis]